MTGLWQSVLTTILLCGADVAPNANYRVGVGIEDITGPAVGVQMAGFVRADQISNGIHQRQWARAFVVSEPKGDRRLAIVILDLAFVSHPLKLEILDRLRAKLGDRYRHDNLIISATHTHCAPGGFHHAMAKNPVGGSFHQQYFDVIAEGATQAVLDAEENLGPGTITFVQGEVENAGVNRSAKAYDANPAEERMRYKSNTDKTMTLLAFRRPDGKLIGILNWFAVHPTSMTFFNKLITGDNKGYASYEIEHAQGQQYLGDKGSFVAAFAQTNCGDVTPNLNLNNTGPGKTDEESTQIIGHRQADVAAKLMNGPGETVTGPLDTRHAFVNFSGLLVSSEFTGRGDQRTCPAAYGYSFAGGSTEDGGGHPLFREGMTVQSPLVDNIVKTAMGSNEVSEEFRACQRPKAILFAPGLTNPPAIEQHLPLGIVRIGQVALVVGPSEYTTMTGRRIREAVAKALEIDPKYVVIAGYSNEFCGYTTTWEEYQTQQYEGGHTLFGPWSESAWRQEFVRLARAMKQNQSAESPGQPTDYRGQVKSVSVEGPDDKAPIGARFGDVVEDAKDSYRGGELVEVKFWTGLPVNDYQRGDRALNIERQDPSGKWITVATETDWSTKCVWTQPVTSEEKPSTPNGAENAKDGPKPKALGDQLKSYNPLLAHAKPKPDPYVVTVSWRIPQDAAAGTYRVVHYGRSKSGGKVIRFETASRAFQIQPGSP
ncbi:MAG: neutral/alkaline non-lysosomal ceramidase N-terminal domain-containing protein [Planctomycetota bacterium]